LEKNFGIGEKSSADLLTVCAAEEKNFDNFAPMLTAYSWIHGTRVTHDQAKVISAVWPWILNQLIYLQDDCCSCSCCNSCCCCC